MTGAVAAVLRQRRPGEELADRVPGADVAGRVGARGLADRRLVDGDELADLFVENRDENVELVVEIKIDCTVRYFGCLGDIGNSGTEKAFFGKNLDRRPDYFFMFIRTFHKEVTAKQF